MKTIICFFILTFTCTFAFADLDEHNQKGLHDTQNLLKSKSERDAFIKKNKDAQDADAKAGAIAGSSENKEELYNMSSEIMEKITTETNGDPAKMQKLLEEAQKDPKSFYEKYFSESQKAKTKKIAEKSSQRKPSADAKP